MEENPTNDNFEDVEVTEDTTADPVLIDEDQIEGVAPDNENDQVHADVQIILDSVSGNQTTLEQLLNDSNEIKESLETVKAQTVETRGTESDYNDSLTDIATMLAYQNMLLMIIGCYVVLSIGVKLGSFLFSYFKDK